MNMYKHLAKITKKVADTREVLQNINYEKETNSITACDSHRLLKIPSKEQIKESFLISPETMQLSNLTYPDTEHLLEIDGTTVEIITESITKNFKKQLVTLKKEYNLLKLVIEGDEIIVYVPKKEDFVKKEVTEEKKVHKIKLVTTVQESLTIYISLLFFIDFIDFFQDIFKENKDEKVTITFKGELNPILFEWKENNYKYLIATNRVNQ